VSAIPASSTVRAFRCAPSSPTSPPTINVTTSPVTSKLSVAPWN
jgi:hypothetical protein